jgi:hypothetical protein
MESIGYVVEPYRILEILTQCRVTKKDKNPRKT